MYDLDAQAQDVRIRRVGKIFRATHVKTNQQADGSTKDKALEGLFVQLKASAQSSTVAEPATAALS